MFLADFLCRWLAKYAGVTDWELKWGSSYPADVGTSLCTAPIPVLSCWHLRDLTLHGNNYQHMICQFVWPQGLRGVVIGSCMSGSIRCHRSGCFVEDGPAVSGLHRAKKSTSLGKMENSEVDSSSSQHFRPLGHRKISILVDAENVEVGEFQVQCICMPNVST